MKQIIQNEAQCTKCGDIIYSAHTHDFKQCSCGAIGVDGGMSYIRRVGDLKAMVNRNMWMHEDDLAKCRDAVKAAVKSGRSDLGIALAVIRALRDAGYLDMDKFSGHE